MRVGGVGADDKNRACMVHIVVAGGGRIHAQRLLVASHRAAHAQTRIAVDVVGADQAFGQFVEDVVVLGQQLARDVETHRIGAVFGDDLAEFVGGQVQRGVPTEALRCHAALQAAHRL